MEKMQPVFYLEFFILGARGARYGFNFDKLTPRSGDRGRRYRLLACHTGYFSTKFLPKFKCDRLIAQLEARYQDSS